MLRILFATLVLLSHAPEITDGNMSRELFHRFTRSPISFGALGVDGFFVLSGYFIGTSVSESVEGRRWSWRIYLVNRLTRLQLAPLCRLGRR